MRLRPHACFESRGCRARAHPWTECSRGAVAGVVAVQAAGDVLAAADAVCAAEVRLPAPPARNIRDTIWITLQRRLLGSRGCAVESTASYRLWVQRAAAPFLALASDDLSSPLILQGTTLIPL